MTHLTLKERLKMSENGGIIVRCNLRKNLKTRTLLNVKGANTYVIMSCVTYPITNQFKFFIFKSELVRAGLNLFIFALKGIKISCFY